MKYYTKLLFAVLTALFSFGFANAQANLIEIPQDQGKSLDDFARTAFVEGDDYNTYTASADLQVAFKMYDIDVQGCDYVVVKFAEPVAAGWCIAFWAQGGTDNVAIPEGATEYKYVFADDEKCAVANDVLPQICMLTLWGAEKPLVAKVSGIYKHKAPAANELEQTLNIERFTGMGYSVTNATVDFTEAKAFLGVDALTTDMLRVVNPDGTKISDYAGYDGWFNGKGVAETWGANTKVCVKFFQAIPDGAFEICDMNGADVEGKTYTVTWALEANDKVVYYNINVTFKKPAAVELAVVDKGIATSITYDVEEGSYVEKTASLTDEQVATICAELGISALSEATIYGYNPTTKELVKNFAGFDGWRDANGDFHNWTGNAEAPACVKYTDGQNYLCYNIAGCSAQTVKTYWAIANDTKAVLVEIDFIYEAAAAEDPELVAPEGWTSLIANGNLATDNVANFVSKEAPSADIVGATIVPGAGKNNSRGLVVKSADEVGKEGAQDWDTQFWIKVNEPLVSGSKLHVEFDYAASKAAKAGTQAHGEPGAYQHWAMVGDVNFTTEWQHFSQDIEIDDAMAKGDNGNGNGIGLISVAFNLAVERTAVEYYFDNFGVWAQLPEPVATWKDLIVNGDMEGESLECFYVTEQGVGGPYVAEATAAIGKDGSKAVKVQSGDNPSQDWDSQFFIRLPYQLPAGTKYKVSFDYKANKAGDFDTQAHGEPGAYIHWAAIGSGSFTTDWKTYEKEGSISSDMSKEGQLMQTIAFNLAKNKVATEFIFDNVKFEVPEDVFETLTLNPATNPVPYAVAIAKKALNDEIANAEAKLADEKNVNGQEELTTAVAAAKDLQASQDVEAINAATAALKTAVGNFVVANAEFPYQKYYIVNAASQLYWGAANDWGTRASLVKHPEYVMLVPLPDGKYQLESQVSNGGTSYYFGGDYMDGQPIALTITKVEEPLGDDDDDNPVYAYTIANGDNYFGWDGTSSVLGKNLAADSENALWLIVPEEKLMENLKNATVDEPVDATFLIIDHTFGRNNRNVSAWTNEGGAALTGGNSNKHDAEKYHGVFNVYQKLANAPAGVYKFEAQGFYRQDGDDNENLPVFYANDVTTAIPVKTGAENSMADACASFEKGLYQAEPIFVEVAEDGELTIGVKLENNTALWCIWDNFVLTYYGENATIKEVQNQATIEELLALRKKATELKIQANDEVIENILNEALAKTAKVGTIEEIQEAITTMKEAIDQVETSLEAKDKLAKMKELIDATNVYTEEAYNEYYGQWYAKYQDGTITKAEVAALQDPFLVTGWHAAITVDNFLLSAWDTNPDFQDAPYYINSWSIEGESDGSEFKVPFFEYWTGDGDSLGERTLTATMNGLEEGEYDVTAWVRVRIKNGAEAPTYGITLQVNDGEAVDVAAGDQVGTTQMYLKEYTATGAVAEDGVLKIKFNVAADNNISWLSFKNVKFEKKEVVHTWDFTKWSDATIANLKADAAASKIAGWSDVEKKADAEADAEPTEASKDNCFWAVIPEGGELTANGEVIEELKGLLFGDTFAGNRSLAIAVNYPSTSLGDYYGPAYLWLGGKNFDCFTIPAVKGGTTITMGIESHKSSDARGVKLLVGENELTDPEGNAVAVPKTYTKQTWQVPAGDAVNVVVKNTNGCHIYFIDAEQDEAAIATSISTVKSNKLDGTIFNLNGQKVNKAQKGLYIINGQKVVVK